VMSYTHDQEGLAHPFGAYFSEAVMILDARVRKKVLLRAKFNMGVYNSNGPDSLGYNYGGNILLSDRDPQEGPDDPVVRQLNYLDLSASYLFNQMSNMQFTIGYWMRDLTPAPDQLNTGYLYVAFRMAIFNRYYDF
ncbi:MAG: hypothetical protein KDB88_01590, partial [Flavobacteriales bacterium]|nr:hypothetical protein [Flavobacteriales bacterium]